MENSTSETYNVKEYIDKLENNIKSERERNTFLQYKSECWRNVSVSFMEAIESNNPENIEKAIEQFEEVKGMFPYSEILIKLDF